MEYFKSLTQKDLASLIQSTERELFVSLPLFHREIADAGHSDRVTERSNRLSNLSRKALR